MSVRERVLIYSVNPEEDSVQYEYMMWGNLAPVVMCDQCDDFGINQYGSESVAWAQVIFRFAWQRAVFSCHEDSYEQCQTCHSVM